MRVEPGHGDARRRLAPARDAACAMRIVQHRIEGDALDGAAQRHWWMVTSTVRSSSLASIMRTGGGAPPCGGERLQHLGVAGKAMPAAASASLWIGAVTMPAACPCCTSAPGPARCSAAAAAPARASTRPAAQASRSAGRPAPAAPAGTRRHRVPHRLGVPRAATASAPPAVAPRGCITADVAEHHAAAAASLRERGDDLGPMPQASPIVSSGSPSRRSCRVVDVDELVLSRRSRHLAATAGAP